MDMKRRDSDSYEEDTLEGYERDIRLEIKFADRIKELLGKYFFIQDMNLDIKGIDFAIITTRNKEISVGARLRRFKYWLRPCHDVQFTIRWCRPSGNPTEIDKIRDGKVNYLFYGFIDNDKEHIIQYFIGDLKLFRENEPEPCRTYWNKTRDSKFAVYNLSECPPKFILYEWLQPGYEKRHTLRVQYEDLWMEEYWKGWRTPFGGASRL